MNISSDFEQAHLGFSVNRYGQQRMNTLVTGGAGFLGSHLCRQLLQSGHKVLCIDNLMTGRMENIQDLIGNNNFLFQQHDIVDPIEITQSLDRIYNLACPASPPQYQKDPIHTFKTCVLGAMNMLELAGRKGARILQASTSEVYGDPEVMPQAEGYFGNVNTCGPRACYDEGKRSAETLFHDYHHAHDVDIRIARIFNTYGPSMSPEDGRVISNFVVQALSGQDITVMGDGSQTRSFCYRDDLVRGLMSFMEHPQKIAEPVNFGRPDEYTVLTIAEKIIDLTESKSRIVFKPLPVDDPKRRRPDISKAQSLLSWTPVTSLEDGLAATIAHFSALAAEQAEQVNSDACVV